MSLRCFPAPHNADRSEAHWWQAQPELRAANSGATVARTMAKQNDHSRLIDAAAQAALVPLGCRRKGQSRLWYSDQRFWVISAEFQPSAWSKGSYLNMGARWLWHRASGIDLSYRPLGFIAFETTEQFTPRIHEMAARAAEEVLAIRQRFRTLANIYRYLIERPLRDGWPTYHAAVAAGLVGDFARAKNLFDQMKQWTTDGYDWQYSLKTDSSALSGLLDHPKTFRSAVLAIIDERRKLMGLPPDPTCLDALDSRAPQ